MNQGQQAQVIERIYQAMSEHVGEEIRVRANMGRSKIIENKGKLTEVYPRLFILEAERKRSRPARQSYQYVDMLTGTVEVSQNGEPLIDPEILVNEPIGEEDNASDTEQILA